MVHEFNRAARDGVVADMLDGTAIPAANPSPLGPEEQRAVGEVDRYNIPFRTVVGTSTGMLWANPYYNEAYLADFFQHQFRKLNRPKRMSLSWFFSEQVRRGQPVLERTAARLPPAARVLDIGCGMGGMLVPFVLAGHHVIGCDFGEEYVKLGQRLGMDIRVGGTEAIADEGPFDLVLLSHVVQHVRDPIDLARQAASLLKPQGLCFIEVPGLLNLEKYYGGDLLKYLQSANRWHFTAGTLTAILRRAGLEIVEIDQTITCLATPALPDPSATASDGPIVLAEIERLERALVEPGKIAPVGQSTRS